MLGVRMLAGALDTLMPLEVWDSGVYVVLNGEGLGCEAETWTCQKSLEADFASFEVNNEGLDML